MSHQFKGDPLIKPEKPISNGDLVIVKGLENSPIMKVLGKKQGSITCYWFDKNQKLHTFRFPEQVIKHSDTFACKWRTIDKQLGFKRI